MRRRVGQVREAEPEIGRSTSLGAGLPGQFLGTFYLFQIDFRFSDCKNNPESRDSLVKIKYFRQKPFAFLFVTTVMVMRLMTISRHGLIC